ncbi:MAG: PDZ domain-containing protein [Desulfobacterales bacterium]|jgi:general secretion pathway protein C|nr:PDZ domain-containing protein [Desulfobacterales bacterium]
MANRYLTLVNLLLASVGIYFGVLIFYAVVTAGLETGPALIERGRGGHAPGPEPMMSLADVQVIVDRNLFNSGKQALVDAPPSEAPALDLEKLKPTGLKLKLWGTVTVPDGQAYAVIEDQKTREQQLLRPGDAVQNAVIKMVLRNRVVLAVEGRDEVLLMEEPGVTRAAAGAPAAEAAPPPRMAAVEPAQQVMVPEDQVAQAIENIGDLLNQATFRPHIEDGRPAGISITGIKPNAIFRRLRLRNGDVITGVNGQTIASVEDAMSVFGTLSTDGPIQVNIKRRGREETLEYKIE